MLIFFVAILFTRCALLKAILKMCTYANSSMMMEQFSRDSDETKASSLATQLCEVISMVMMGEVRIMFYI